MKEVPGKREGSSLFFHENFSYNLDKRCEDTFRCSSRRKTFCRGLLIRCGDEYILKTAHNHTASKISLEIAIMKEKMLKMCRDTSMRPKEIFHVVCRRNPAAAKHLSYTSMKTILNRERAKSRPPLPKSVGELDEVFQNYECIHLVYQGSVLAEDGTMAFLFSTNVLLEALSASKELYVDGLCSVVPKDLQLVQLYTVHIRYIDKGICAVFALCEARTTALYCAIWKKINELAPGLEENVEFTMSDYERAALNALEKSFPTADVHCCWFHFKQAVTRKWKSLGLDKESSDLLLMTTSLPLIPEDKFEEAIGILENVANADSSDNSKETEFISYIRRTWLPLASKVSVYKCRVRTNNIVESFNNIANHKLGGNHPNLWVFLDRLKQFIEDQELDLGRLKNRQAVGRARSRKSIERDAKIFQAQTDLASGRLPLEQFLLMFDNRREKDREELDTLEGEDNKEESVQDNPNAHEQVVNEMMTGDEETSLGQDKMQAAAIDVDQLKSSLRVAAQVVCETAMNEEDAVLDKEIEAQVNEGKQKEPVKGHAVRRTLKDGNMKRKPMTNKDVDNEQDTVVKRALHGKVQPVVVLHRLTIQKVLKEKTESKTAADDRNPPSKRKLPPQREAHKRVMKKPQKHCI